MNNADADRISFAALVIMAPLIIPIALLIITWWPGLSLWLAGR